MGRERDGEGAAREFAGEWRRVLVAFDYVL
jgi:hypothetical protein